MASSDSKKVKGKIPHTADTSAFGCRTMSSNRAIWVIVKMKWKNEISLQFPRNHIKVGMSMNVHKCPCIYKQINRFNVQIHVQCILYCSICTFFVSNNNFSPIDNSVLKTAVLFSLYYSKSSKLVVDCSSNSC